MACSVERPSCLASLPACGCCCCCWVVGSDVLACCCCCGAAAGLVAGAGLLW